MLSIKYLEERRKGIGGSDIAAILGLSPFKTPYQVYQEKRREVEDWKGNQQTEWGSRLEPLLRQWYSDTTGRDVRLPEKIMYHAEYPFLMASLDGFTDDGRVVECKTARSSKGWGEPGTNEIPDYYALQCQHYLLVTGFDVADVPVSIMGGSPVLYEVPADIELQEMIIDGASTFWEMVENGTPPPPVTYADAIQRYGRIQCDGFAIANQDAIFAQSKLITFNQNIKELEAEADEMKAALIIAMGGNADTLLDVDGSPLCTYKMAKGRESLDSKRLEKELPDIYKAYLRTSEPSRRFLLK